MATFSGGNFSAVQFLWPTFILVVVPTTVLLIFLLRKETYTNLSAWLMKLTKAFLAGFFTAVVWLSWGPGRPVIEVFVHGAPVNFAHWQIVGCGATLIILDLLIFSRSKRTVQDLIGISTCAAAGFSTAFALGTAFGANPQLGIGIFLSYIGIGILLLVVNASAMMALHVKRHIQ